MNWSCRSLWADVGLCSWCWSPFFLYGVINLSSSMINTLQYQSWLRFPTHWINRLQATVSMLLDGSQTQTRCFGRNMAVQCRYTTCYLSPTMSICQTKLRFWETDSYAVHKIWHAERNGMVLFLNSNVILEVQLTEDVSQTCDKIVIPHIIALQVMKTKQWFLCYVIRTFNKICSGSLLHQMCHILQRSRNWLCPHQ